MNDLVILTTAFALSMDAFSVSVSKSMGIKKLTNFIALKISLSFGFYQGFMTFLGWLLGISFEKYISAIDHWIALILLSYLGLRMINEFLKENKLENNNLIINKNNTITNGEIFMLSIATSIDALAVGISFVFTDINIIRTSITVAVVTFIMCIIGTFIGSKIGNVSSKYSNLIGGLILIFIGLSIFDEHTGLIRNLIGIL